MFELNVKIPPTETGVVSCWHHELLGKVASNGNVLGEAIKDTETRYL